MDPADLLIPQRSVPSDEPCPPAGPAHQATDREPRRDEGQEFGDDLSRVTRRTRLLDRPCGVSGGDPRPTDDHDTPPARSSIWTSHPAAVSREARWVAVSGVSLKAITEPGRRATRGTSRENRPALPAPSVEAWITRRFVERSEHRHSLYRHRPSSASPCTKREWPHPSHRPKADERDGSADSLPAPML